MKYILSLFSVLMITSTAGAAGESVPYEVDGAPYKGYFVSADDTVSEKTITVRREPGVAGKLRGSEDANALYAVLTEGLTTNAA